MGRWTRGKVAIICLMSVLLIDAITKFYVHTSLPEMNTVPFSYPYGGISVFKNIFGVEFSISHATNRGAAWGILSHYQLPLLIFRIILITFLCGYTVFAESAKRYQIPLALIIAGAFGNIADTFFYGHVVDMLHFVLFGYDYPVFNIADASICVGVILMMVTHYKDSKRVRDC